jgi:hypothetical protein
MVLNEAPGPDNIIPTTTRQKYYDAATIPREASSNLEVTTSPALMTILVAISFYSSQKA